MAHFLARPQRFLVSVRLADGTATLAYCANPGSFRGCIEAGSEVLLWDSEAEERKRRYTWRAIHLAGTWVGTDTHLANTLVGKALHEKQLPKLTEYNHIQREPSSRKGRLDFKLSGTGPDCLLEVKSATIAVQGVAQFPDSVSPRATNHVRELTKQVKAGHRSVIIFLVQRGDVTSVRINREADPIFGRAIKRALAEGVELMGVRHHLSTKGFGMPELIPVVV